MHYCSTCVHAHMFGRIMQWPPLHYCSTCIFVPHGLFCACPASEWKNTGNMEGKCMWNNNAGVTVILFDMHFRSTCAHAHTVRMPIPSFCPCPASQWKDTERMWNENACGTKMQASLFYCSTCIFAPHVLDTF